MNNDSNSIINYLIKELQMVSGVTAGDAKCKILHRWRYANIANQTNHQGLIDFDQKLVACGDWCIAGRVESAFLVGHAVAQKILANIN
jgi:predicted NAD/FAD-dependent oxidoreductase